MSHVEIPFLFRISIDIVFDRGDLLTYYGMDRNAKLVLRDAAQMAFALSFLHQNGFEHRDIKPENILVCPCNDSTNQYVVLLGDLGLSTNFQKHYFTLQEVPSTFEHQVLGTAGYQPPEMASSKIQFESLE